MDYPSGNPNSRDWCTHTPGVPAPRDLLRFLAELFPRGVSLCTSLGCLFRFCLCGVVCGLSLGTMYHVPCFSSYHFRRTHLSFLFPLFLWFLPSPTSHFAINCSFQSDIVLLANNYLINHL